MARIRVGRINEQIKKELSHILQHEIKDPRIGFVTVTAVKTSGDLQFAKVYVSVYGSTKEKQETLAGLEKAKGYIRTEIGRRIQIRHIPELHFTIDNTLERSEHIDRLLDQVKSVETDDDA